MSQNEAPGMSLAEDLKINKFNLDDECVVQPSRFFYWADRAAAAKTALDRAVNRQELTEAEALERARAKLEAAGYKTTVDAIKAEALQDPEVKKAKEAVLDAKEDVYRLDAAVRAFDHRKSELDNLTKLHAAGVFSIPFGGIAQSRPDNTGTVGRVARAGLNRKENDE